MQTEVLDAKIAAAVAAIKYDIDCFIQFTFGGMFFHFLDNDAKMDFHYVYIKNLRTQFEQTYKDEFEKPLFYIAGNLIVAMKAFLGMNETVDYDEFRKFIGLVIDEQLQECKNWFNLSGVVYTWIES